MKSCKSQSGVTLVVSMIMLIVLTLLVVSAIRFGNINLKIAQNTQAEVEAAAAAQVAIEQMMADINDAPDIAALAAKPNENISTGGVAYKVAVAKPACVLTRNVQNTELNHTDPEDQKCYGSPTGDIIIGSDGLPLAQPTECKLQQWEVQAGVSDTFTGVNLTMVQGASVRVSVEVLCP